MFERDENGRLKRIEYRGKHLRASRTGGVALRAQTSAAGVNLTANTNRGMRMSTRVAEGTQAAFQNGRFILRGRYGEGPTKLNLSKSGVSVSTRTETGTINWFKPGYSSAKIGGVQVRGKKAVYIQLVVALVQLIAYLALFLLQAVVVLAQAAFWLTAKAWTALRRAHARREQPAIRKAEGACFAALRDKDAQFLRDAMEAMFLQLAQGQPLDAAPADRENSDPEGRFRNPDAEALVASLLERTELSPPRSLEVLFGCLAERYGQRAGDDAALRRFLDFDQAAVASGGRNRLQERLLAAYADACGIDLDGHGARSPGSEN